MSSYLLIIPHFCIPLDERYQKMLLLGSRGRISFIRFNRLPAARAAAFYTVTRGAGCYRARCRSFTSSRSTTPSGKSFGRWSPCVLSQALSLIMSVMRRASPGCLFGHSCSRHSSASCHSLLSSTTSAASFSVGDSCTPHSFSSASAC